jgi:predicted amidohydrolase YtcJ
VNESASRTPSDHPDWILVGAALHADGAYPSEVTALGVRGGRLAFVGDDAGARAWLGGRGPEVRGGGAHVYPGLVDAHAHLQGLGKSLEEVALEGAGSAAEAAVRAASAAAELPQGAWVTGRGWDQNDWPGAPWPSAAVLDAAVGGRPAYLTRKDGHAAWVSGAAIALAGITRDSGDPEGGKILRDAQGRPSGVLVDNAMDLVGKLRPAESEATLARRYAKARDACARAGLTGMHDMGVSAATLAALRRLDEAGELGLRVYALLDDIPELWSAEFARGPQTARPGGRLTVRAVKLYADGALGSRGAALLEDYSDEPGNRGLLLLSLAALEERVRQAADAGYQVCVHAIGDRGNRVVLDAFEKVLGARHGGGLVHALRPRVEHCQVLHPDDIARFARLGVIASLQPTHCTSDMGWAEQRLGRERCRGAYAWRALAGRGVPLAFGSDFPVESPDPRRGLHAAVTRQDAAGAPPGGWFPEQRLSLAEALRAFTTGAALAAFGEAELGCLARGQLADLTIFDRDLGAGPPAGILAAQVWATVTGGRPLFAAEPERWRGVY